jgi:acetylornithine deacetylase/succinyl-diaminopimelate desuccinylase-like protein
MTTDRLASRVLDEIDAGRIARDALAFVSVPSETGREGPGSLFLAELLRREGFEPTLDEVEPDRPNVYARLGGRGAPQAGPALLLNGHTDTIPIGASDPPGREGEWIVGRGAEDMKGGLTAMVHAAGALRRAGAPLAGDVWLTGVVGHETPVGKKEGPRRLIRRLREGAIRADAILIVEGPCAVWSASLGSAVFEITIESERGPIHTLHVPYAENPALWLGKLLTRLGEHDAALAARPHHPLCGRERLNVGTVHGGDYMNRLPTPIRVSGQRRWAPGTSATEVLAELQALCDSLDAPPGIRFTVRLEGEREPFETPREHPLVRALESAAVQAGGPAAQVIGMPLVGDANLYANEARVPTVYYGPEYRTAHSDRERVLVSRLAHCARVYALAALAFCGRAQNRA